MLQREEALLRANKVRKQRSKLKKDLKTGMTSILEVLSEPPEYVYTMKVEALLFSVPGWGKTKVKAIQRAARVSANTEVGDLTPQRLAEVSFVIRRYLPK